MFGWLDPERRERRKQISLNRKHFAARSRRFLRNYLNANEAQKADYFRVVEQASKQCHPNSVLSSPEVQDAEIAKATSSAATRIVLERVRLTGPWTNLSPMPTPPWVLPTTGRQGCIRQIERCRN